jgi:integrase
MRAGELCGLRRRDVDMAAGILRVDGALSEVYSKHLPEDERGLRRGDTKNGHGRTSALPAVLRSLFAEHLMRMDDPSPDALVFTTPDGNPVRHGNFYRQVFRPTVSALWPEPDERHRLTFHGLRHSAASVLARRGAPEREMPGFGQRKRPAIAGRSSMPPEGIEPSTFGLRVRCSAS